jgi:hypothetical protein
MRIRRLGQEINADMTICGCCQDIVRAWVSRGIVETNLSFNRPAVGNT